MLLNYSPKTDALSLENSNLAAESTLTGKEYFSVLVVQSVHLKN